MRRLVAILLLALLAAPASARAGFFPGETVDGPSPDISAVGDIDIAREGTGALVYLKKEGGVDHVFLSTLGAGAFGAGQRLDGALAGAASQPVVASSELGRGAVAWVTDGTLYAAVRTRGAPGFGTPVAIAAGGVSNPTLDMSIHGVTYLAWAQGGDVRVARAERDGTAFTVLGQPADLDPARAAGATAETAPRVSVAADGAALVVWGEDGADGRTHVVARRVFEQRLSAAAHDLTVPAPGSATRPDVEMEDDSSFAQVVFTQAGRVHARRLVGSEFDPPVIVDAGAGLVGRVDLAGRGEGLFGVEAGGAPIGSTTWDEALTFTGPFGSPSLPGTPVLPAVGENEEGMLAWLGSDPAGPVVRAKHVDGLQRPVFSPEATLSSAPVDPAAGMVSAPTRLGDVFVAFVQGAGADRRLVTGVYDRPPSRPALYTTSRLRGLAPLRWSPSYDLLSVTYTVLVDGRPIGTSPTAQLKPTRRTLRDGRHRWQVVATDRRGQRQVSRTGTLLIDATPPRLGVSLRRSGRVLTVIARGGDSRGRLRSGLSRVVVRPGDGRRVRVRGGATTIRYRRGGTYTVVVTARDRAGNATHVRRRVRV